MANPCVPVVPAGPRNHDADYVVLVPGTRYVAFARTRAIADDVAAKLNRLPGKRVASVLEPPPPLPGVAPGQ